MKNENHEAENKELTPKEQQEFLELLDRMTPKQREALKKVLLSFI